MIVPGALILKSMWILINKTGEVIYTNRVESIQAGRETYYEISGMKYSKKEIEFLYSHKELEVVHTVQEIAISVLPALITLAPDKKIKDNIKKAIDYAYELAEQLGLTD